MPPIKKQKFLLKRHHIASQPWNCRSATIEKYQWDKIDKHARELDQEDKLANKQSEKLDRA